MIAAAAGMGVLADGQGIECWECNGTHTIDDEVTPCPTCRANGIVQISAYSALGLWLLLTA